MTQSTVVHRERTPVRDENGRIEYVFEREWTEGDGTHAKGPTAVAAIAKYQVRVNELQKRLRDEGAAKDARLQALEAQLVALRAAHEAERSATMEAIAAATARAIERDGTETPKLLAAVAELARSVTLDALPSMAAPYVLPADLIDVAGLRELEQQLLEAEHVADPERAVRDRVTWVLPAEVA